MIRYPLFFSFTLSLILKPNLFDFIHCINLIRCPGCLALNTKPSRPEQHLAGLITH